MAETHPHDTHLPSITGAASSDSPPATPDEIQLFGPESSSTTPPPAFKSQEPTPQNTLMQPTATVHEPSPERPTSLSGASPSPQEGVVEEQIAPDPRVAPLKAMFPDMDDSILLSVLESVGGNQDQAIDVLLGMSDPDYVPQQHPQQQPEPPMSQTDLDEQLARRLMLEEQEAAARHYQQAQQRRDPQRRSTNIGTTGGYAEGWYGQDNQNQGQGQGQRDTVAEFQEAANKIAESGKRTFNSIVSKVRSKMQEYNEGRTSPGQPSNQQHGQGQQSAPYYAPQTVTQADWSAGQPRTNTYGQPVAASGWQPQPQSQQPQNNATNAGGGRWQYDSTSAPAAPGGRGYDVDDDPEESLYQDAAAPAVPPHAGSGSGSPPPPAGSGATPAARSSIGANPGFSTPRTSVEGGGGGVPRPPSTGAGSPGSIDPSKLGILPKRPVSLLRTASPPAANTAVVAPPPHRGASDDELEYAENPFEDRG
ncbi:hypothetical protein CONPUDRAFT_142032 [Coniophora puteana RWD-64-598 SS2]|uniref:CUE domain-containing protein n=1 Tax=Coniophora puteana (strain RWD-64-598) TaxID=741705 RepID=A0A5M3N284_CONPW|nr:uncharacterized protein CONPUDRAFT_142032 [Coniophora puteana RWD-64-598 SS2]EIW85489.1 hypothetical protein CONPUDRAFT_142032 [Coniophora puteana RWD-64-598 SS2]